MADQLTNKAHEAKDENERRDFLEIISPLSEEQKEQYVKEFDDLKQKKLRK